jgi:hypothetical protein
MADHAGFPVTFIFVGALLFVSAAGFYRLHRAESVVAASAGGN